jgi:hypothetical protein
MRNKFTENRKFERVKKTFAVLLVLCFVLSATVASANATEKNENKDGYDKNKDGFDKNKDGFGKNKEGYIIGYKKGIDDGRKHGQKDCEQYGSRETLSKIPIPGIKYSWPDNYKKSYEEGYRTGYISSYNEIRYNCLKNKNKIL